MLCLVLNAQNNDTWKEYSFGDYCSLSIPNTLELRDGASETGKFMDKNVHRFTLKFGAEAANKQIVFQPVGMNSGDPELFHAANEKYARVIVELLSSGGITSSDIDNASASDIEELNAGFYESYAADGAISRAIPVVSAQTPKVLWKECPRATFQTPRLKRRCGCNRISFLYARPTVAYRG